MEKYTPYSELKVFHHTECIDKFIKGERPAPIYVRIKPTNVCNQSCYYCGYADDIVFKERKLNHREFIPWDIMKSTLCDMKEMGVKAVTFSGGGDPLCYPYILETLRMVNDLNIDYSMITNGQALRGDVAEYLTNAKWIRVSLDASKSDTYEKIRRTTTFDNVISNIEEFAHKRSENCTLGINCVVSNENSDEIFDICNLVKKLGVDNIKLSPIMVKSEMKEYHDEIKTNVITQINEAKGKLENDSFSVVDRYSSEIERIEDNYEKEYCKCHIQNFFTVIAADCKVYRCHSRAYMKVGELGDLTKNSFKEVWYSQDTINKINSYNPQKECKFRCAFDARNKLLDDFINIDKNHVNFI